MLLLAALSLAATTVLNLATQVTGLLAAANGGTGINSTATFPTSGTVIGVKSAALTPGTTVTVDFSTGTVFTLTPAQAETINATNCTAGNEAGIIITTSGTTAFTLTFSTNFKAASTLSTGVTSGKVFQINFRCNGATATEMGRTAAM